MNATLLSLLTFASITLALISIASLISDLVLRDRSRLQRRLSDEFRDRQKASIRKSSLFKEGMQLRDLPGLDQAEASVSLPVRIETMLEQSGLGWSLQRFLGLTVASGLAPGMLAAVIQQSVMLALVGVLIGLPLPWLYVRSRRRARLDALCAQLPEAYDLMARGLRAGQTISLTMQGVAEEFPQPIAAEFGYCYEQQNLGLAPEVALHDLARRTSLMEINIFVVAVVIQKQVGGNLAEMLEKLAAIVRDRARLRGTIRTLTAEGRLQAVLLMMLPPGMLAAMLLLNREYAITLFQHPMLIVGTLISMGCGALWIRKIINFDF